ncbi:MAG: hypothetical protein F6J92_35990, partial [Symploca sp. SIO1A3]|nr:hypothetical protein [Symploca sp. SIO1A3]
EMSQGQFKLILAHCNYGSLRQQMVQRLQEISSVPIREIVLQSSVKKLYFTIREQVGDEEPPALMILGLESVSEINQLLISMNSVREEFRKHCRFPLVLWINDEISQKLSRSAPDVTSWGTLTKFVIVPQMFSHELQQQADGLFARILEWGVSQFIPNDAIFSSGYRQEIKAALRDLNRQGQNIEPALQANLYFIQGRDAYTKDEIDTALAQYQQSLDFWHHSNNLERQGVLWFHIGLCHRRRAELDSAGSRPHWQKAKDSFEQCLDFFEQADNADLVAKFITQLGEVWRQLEDWDKLHQLAQKSQQLHQANGNRVLLAQDYGFLAEVALERRNWNEANALATRALQTLETVSDEQRQHWHLYPLLLARSQLLLARSQRQLGQVEEAVANLERAKQGKPQDDPQLYIQILKELRSLYKDEQHQYLKAFEVKQECRSIEQQFRFRAFIGAGRLQSQRQVNRTVTLSSNQEELAQEIIDSGRKPTVDELISRIESRDKKLTVIHGLSGVGKSSLVNAGLVPALKLKKSSDTRDILVVTLRAYNNWVKELGKNLAQELNSREIILPSIPDSRSTLIQELSRNGQRNLLTVLIFDQFEEFFFVCPSRQEQQIFFTFLKECLDIDYIKIILSLREDYLHYLLPLNNIGSKVINDDILGKTILYQLGNLQPEAAKNLIKNLTSRSRVHFEEDLIDQLVKDLAHNLGEVRPIELQVIGAQMQTEGIRTLAEYQQVGSKENLVQRYLEEVIEDCGAENEQAARLVLYLLTDEKESRPLKTRTELEKELKALENNGIVEADELDLVLEIFRQSGLVLLLPETPSNRYQLVHDYLVSFIRKQQSLAEKLNAEKEEERKQRILAEDRVRQKSRQDGYELILISLILIVAIILSILSKKILFSREIYFFRGIINPGLLTIL